jgi:colanic acid/amylovoran biosynthesis glycosyltransferase
MSIHVAYLINQYPKVSHSFIRREILALERQGLAVQRIAVRGWADEVVDPEDLRERERTQYLLQGGVWPLLVAMLKVFFSQPARFLSALVLATRMGWRADRALPYHWIYLAEAALLYRWLKHSGASHLHAHFGTNPAEVAMLVHVLGGPSYSFTVHGPEEFDKPLAIGLGEKVRHAAFVVAISSFGRSQLFRWVPHEHWSKIHVVHCGLEAGFHAVVTSDPPDVSRLVCVGRLCEQKGQLLLVEAVAQLAQRGLRAELVLAGDGEMRADVEALVRSRGIEPLVRITGWISGSQVREEILAARALILPSFAEGLPVVIMEAMALRRPVITTFVAGIPELVRPGEGGWLVPAGDVEELASAMAECLNMTPASLARMGTAAHARVLARHDIDIEAAKLAGLLQRLSSAERLGA